MSFIPQAFLKAARSRFWLTFAMLWLVGWVSVGSGHALLHDWGAAQAHCGSAPLSLESHPETSCALCQIGQVALVAPLGAPQLVLLAPMFYLGGPGHSDDTSPVPPGFASNFQRGPPLTSIFA
ncbi:hypothetical protein EON80_23290 [bacterium]|nr:MAG: hypothetical protein EON80_23290 [bacterium]